MPIEFYIDGIEKKRFLPGWDGDGVQGVGQSRDNHGRWRRGAVSAVIAAVLASSAGMALYQGSGMLGHHNASGMGHNNSHSQVDVPVNEITPMPAPKSAKGFTKMWDQVSTDEWGAADVSLSVPMPDGRSVWLYGDTFSGNNGFVHSTAITQDGGNLHVSNGGKQLLPNDPSVGGRESIYWIEAGTAVGKDKIKVTAAPMSVGKDGMLDFQRRSMLSRLGLVKVDSSGDAHFVKWLKWVPKKNGFFDVSTNGKGVTYEHRAHPEFKLKSGKTLMTYNQNYNGPIRVNADGTIDYGAYRPVFYGGDGVEHHQEGDVLNYLDAQTQDNMVVDPSVPQVLGKSGLPLWDGDGVQGVGQPRGPHTGKWINTGGAVRSAIKMLVGAVAHPDTKPFTPSEKRTLRWAKTKSLVDLRDGKGKIEKSIRRNLDRAGIDPYDVNLRTIRKHAADHARAMNLDRNRAGNSKFWFKSPCWAFREIDFSVHVLLAAMMEEKYPNYAKQLRSTSPRWKGKKIIHKNLNPLWDGDGVQGVGQPRDRMGRWIGLPGPLSLMKIAAFKISDKKWEVHGVDNKGHKSVLSTYRTKKAANTHVHDSLVKDRDAYLKAQKDLANVKRRKTVASDRRSKIADQRAVEARDQKVIADQELNNQSMVPSTGRSSSKKPAKAARVTHNSDIARLEAPGRPTQDQANQATAHARRTMPDNEAKYAGLIVRLLKNKGITQDPKKRHELSQRYDIPANRLVDIEQQMYDHMFPPHNKKSADRRKALVGASSKVTEQQINAMSALGARKGTPEYNTENPDKPSRYFKINKGNDRGKWGKVSWNGIVSVVSDKEAQTKISDSKAEWTKRILSRKDLAEKRRLAYRRAQAHLLSAHIDDVKREKGVKRAAASKWADSMGLDSTDTYWHAFFWNDPSLLSAQTNENSKVPLLVNLEPAMRREKMDPALLEGILAMPDMDSKKMRGKRPGSKKLEPGDPGFVEAGDKARTVDPNWESKNLDRSAAHQSRIRRAYQNYKNKHPNSKMSLADFTDDYYNNKLRIPGGTRVVRKAMKLVCSGCGESYFTDDMENPKHEGKMHDHWTAKSVSKRRPQPEGYIRETEKINENKKTYEKTVHKFKAAKWTHPNGHPRCFMCGEEESFSPECNREATKAEEDAVVASWGFNTTAPVSKAALNPFWDGDGLQGVGQPRGYHGRWVRLPGKSALKKIGVWAHSDGSFGVYGDGENLISSHTTARAAEKKAAKIFAEDRLGSSVFDHAKKTIAGGQKIKRPQKGSSHNNKLGDGTPVKRRRQHSSESAYYLRNNGDTKITDTRLREIYQDRSKTTPQEFDLIESAAGDANFDGEKLISFRAVREGGAQRKMERFMMIKNLRTQLAQDFAKEKGKGHKGAGGQILIHGPNDRRAKAQRVKDNEKRVGNKRNYVKRVVKQQMLNDFGDGTRAKCIFCRKPVRIEQVSTERMRPGPIGGKYERGNMAPAHVSCNNKHGHKAQKDPEGYFDEMIAKFLSTYEVEIKGGKLNFVFNKNRKKFNGRRSAA